MQRLNPTTALAAIKRNQQEPEVPQNDVAQQLQMPRHPLSRAQHSIKQLAKNAAVRSTPSASQQFVPHSTFGHNDPQQPIALLTGRQFDDLTGGSHSARFDRLNQRSPCFDPSHPKPIKLTGTSIRFLLTELNSWINSRIEASRS
jgi:predicted DNA-binding transcriptional regulator AlpA